jgi:MFS family permease
MGAENSIQDRIRSYFSVRIEKKYMYMIFISVIGFLIWFTAFPLFGPIMANFLNELRALAIEKGRMFQIFLLTMSVSSFVTGYIIDKTVKRILFIWASTLAASIITFVFLFTRDILMILPLMALLGVLSGVNPTAWGTFFADNTSPEDRGRLMSIPVAFSFPIAYLFLVTGPIDIGGIRGAGFLIIALILLVTLLTFALKPEEKTDEINKARRSRGAGSKQTIFYALPVFLFYVVGGVLFSIVFPTIQNNVSTNVFYFAWSIPFLFGAIIGGILLDTRGRKFPMIVGLAITGVSLAILGIIGIRLGLICVTSLAIGYSIVMVSSFIVWSDLAPIKSRGLYNGIGFGLIAIALMIGLTIVGTIFGSVSASSIRSYMFFSSVALFLCIPPLIVAEDALPHEVIEKRQLEDHLRKARERVRKRKK